MNGMTRYFSRKEKNDKRPLKHRSKSADSSPASQHPDVPTDYYTIFARDPPRYQNKEEDKKVQALLARLQDAGITRLGEPQVYCALYYHPHDFEKAYEALLLANDAFEGVITQFDPKVVMLGAVNRNMVTCYLDALLFAMFARLDSFEAMLYDKPYGNDPRTKLAALLRLWVNFLRTGRLIDIEFTRQLQETLAQCGWEDAAEVRQQDASEAFTFITDALELPLLTLKMDIYHTGREDKEDDHKFVNERLLEVALPEPEEGRIVTLEDCLEAYFNNRIEVKRYLQRQNTTDSGRHTDRDSEKNLTVHIEAVEVPDAGTPTVSTPTSAFPNSLSPSVRPIEGRRRADSIFTERYHNSHLSASDKAAFDEKRHLEELWKTRPGGRPRASSLRKEVLMPAWQFFSLIPWYTDNVPQTDAQVAAHFSSKRPVLGICLKRYQMLADGSTRRLNTFVDIPLEIGLPHFVSDDRVDEVGPLFGNFKLVLQSVVCHRGMRIDSGHYISLVRANKKPQQDLPQTSRASADDEEIADSWLLFDDLARERVREVDIRKALQDESPYLLFFQVQPIDEELASRGDPPSYSESQYNTTSPNPSKETLTVPGLSGNGNSSGNGPDDRDWEKVPYPGSVASEEPEIAEPPGRASLSSNRRSSIAIELEDSIESLSFTRGRTAPTTPNELAQPSEKEKEKPSGFFLSAGRRGSRGLMGGNKDGKSDGDNGKGKSRPSSQSGENRLSLTLSRLTGRVSKDKLSSTGPSATVTEGVPPDAEDTARTHTADQATNLDGAEPTPTDDQAQAAQPGLLTPGFSLSKEKSSDGGTSLLGRRKSRFGRGDKDKDKDKDESKKEKKEKSRLRSKSKEPDVAAATALDKDDAEEYGTKEGKHVHHHHSGLGHQLKHKGRPDRECTIM